MHLLNAEYSKNLVTQYKGFYGRYNKIGINIKLQTHAATQMHTLLQRQIKRKHAFGLATPSKNPTSLLSYKDYRDLKIGILTSIDFI